jgi:hypothetical protein
MRLLQDKEVEAEVDPRTERIATAASGTSRPWPPKWTKFTACDFRPCLPQFGRLYTLRTP